MVGCSSYVSMAERHDIFTNLKPRKLAVKMLAIVGAAMKFDCCVCQLPDISGEQEENITGSDELFSSLGSGARHCQRFLFTLIKRLVLAAGRCKTNSSV